MLKNEDEKQEALRHRERTIPIGEVVSEMNRGGQGKYGNRTWLCGGCHCG